jgi:hypothetical protein
MRVQVDELDLLHDQQPLQIERGGGGTGGKSGVSRP